MSRVEELLATLTPREEQILRLRYGVGERYGSGFTLQQVGKQFSVSRERIRQIEERALMKCPELATLLCATKPKHCRTCTCPNRT